MTRRRHPRRACGFTLVELVITLVLFGIMAATLVVFFKPAFSTYLAARSRSSPSVQDLLFAKTD